MNKSMVTWLEDEDDPPTGYVDNEDGTRTWYALTESGNLMRFDFNENGTRNYYINKDRLEAAGMMETFAPDEPELSTEEFEELTEAMRQAREETSPDESGGSA